MGGKAPRVELGKGKKEEDEVARYVLAELNQDLFVELRGFFV